LLGGLSFGPILTRIAVVRTPDGRFHPFVCFLDVGLSNVIFIQCPNAQPVLVAGGPHSSLLLAHLGKTVPFRNRSLDSVVLSHAGADHLSRLVDASKSSTCFSMRCTRARGSRPGFRLMGQGEASSKIGSLEPAVVVRPGQDLRGEVLSVLSKVGFFVYCEGSTPYVKELASHEASDYSYRGQGSRIIIAGRYGVRTPGYNHVEVFSTMDEYAIPVFGHEVDYEEINLVGHRLQKIFAYAYDTNDECDDRAVAQLRKHDTSKKRRELVTLRNVGLQLLDAVTVTDPRAGVSGEVHRVRGIVETYDTTKKPLVYEQRVALGER